MADKPGRQPMDHLQAEATRDPNEPIVVECWGKKFTVAPMPTWKSSALRAMREGNLDAWAEKVMDARSYMNWQIKDPTIDEAGDFLTIWSDLAAESIPS